MNPRSLFSSVVLTTSLYAIVAYMNAEKLTMKDISLVDACYKAHEAGSASNFTCWWLQESKIEWDTTLDCIQGLDDPRLKYQPRDFFTLDKTSRSLKGEGDVLKDIASLPEPKGICSVPESEKEDITSLIVAKRESLKRDLGLGGILNKVAGLANHGACTVGYLISQDRSPARAICAGNTPQWCTSNHASSGTHGYWTAGNCLSGSLGGECDYINRACVAHDWCVGGASNHRQDPCTMKYCDKLLSDTFRGSSWWRQPKRWAIHNVFKYTPNGGGCGGGPSYHDGVTAFTNGNTGALAGLPTGNINPPRRRRRRRW